LKRLRAASAEEIAAVPGISRRLAEEIRTQLVRPEAPTATPPEEVGAPEAQEAAEVPEGSEVPRSE
jgi:hypothetical protein